MGNWESLSVKYKWMTRGENCKICDALAGRVFTYDTWISTSVVPGFHLHCNCYLKKMPDDTPVSDMDIFGSDIDIMLDNHHFLGISWNSGWQPYNIYFTREVSKAMQENGMTIGEAIKSLTDTVKEGLFYKSRIKGWDQFFQWRVFRTLNIYEGAEDNISNSLSPAPTFPTAATPSQTYQSSSSRGH